MSDRKRKIEPEPSAEDAADEQRRKRAAKAAALKEGGAEAASAQAASSSAGSRASLPLPDEADGEAAAYFDSEDAADASLENGHAANGNGAGSAAPPHRPTTSDSTVEPDERADALEAYMAQIEAQQGALANQPKPEANSRCVLLEQLLTAASAADADELHQTRMETGHECSKWGALLRVHCVGAFDEEMQPLTRESVA